MKRLILNAFRAQQAGLILIILVLGIAVTLKAHVLPNGMNPFLNTGNITQIITNAVVWAIMAVGITMVIITGGIDLSVGATYALSGVMMAMVLERVLTSGLLDRILAWGILGHNPTLPLLLIALGISLGVGMLCGLINGVAVVVLRVHPFIITLGTMWIFRGIAFVSSMARSIPVPDALTTNITKNTLLASSQVYPVPMLVMLAVAILGEIYLLKTVMGRNVYAVGGNLEAARYCGLRINRSIISVYVIAGLTAGMAAFIGATYYGSACCSDGTGYELYVIASAVVGGASLMGGKGSALSAMLGAVLISLIQNAPTPLRWDLNYQWIIIGSAIVIAVVLDRLGTELSAKRMARAANTKLDTEVETPVTTN